MQACVVHHVSSAWLNELIHPLREILNACAICATFTTATAQPQQQHPDSICMATATSSEWTNKFKVEDGAAVKKCISEIVLGIATPPPSPPQQRRNDGV